MWTKKNYLMVLPDHKICYNETKEVAYEEEMVVADGSGGVCIDCGILSVADVL